MNASAALTVGSACSGVGGLDRGLHRAGHRIRWHCEQDRYRRRVLARHWPDVPCHPDLERLARDPAGLEPVDVLAGGTPCPDFSTAKAGRQGLEGDRSRLFWDFAELRNRLNVEWTVWENVDGALSTHEGMDFALVLGAFVGARVHVPRRGWPRAGVVAGPWGGCVWRVLDAQHFGTPQRRHRVFVVGRLGGPCPPEVLLEPQGGGGDPAPRRPARQESARALGGRVAGTLGASPGRVRTDDLDGHGDGAYVAAGEPVVTAYREAQKAHHADDGERWEPADAAPTLSAAGGDANATIVVPYNVATAEGGTPIGAREARHAAALRSARGGTEDAGTVVVTADVAATLTAFAGGAGRCEADDLNLVACGSRSSAACSRAAARETDIASALLRAGAKAPLTTKHGRRFPQGQEDGQLVITLDGLRRLSPTECERLQGLPDGWTIPWGPSLLDTPAWHERDPADQPAASPWDPPDRLDTPRRSACGDAVNAAVAEWIGRRLGRCAAAAARR